MLFSKSPFRNNAMQVQQHTEDQILASACCPLAVSKADILAG